MQPFNPMIHLLTNNIKITTYTKFKMKKITTSILSIIALGQFVTAQITINKSDMPKIGEQYIFSQVSGQFNPGNAGATQQWDFSNLLAGIPLETK